jgi:hypothetical protein
LRGKRWVGELALRVLHVLHVRRVLHLLNTNPFSPPPSTSTGTQWCWL